MKTTFFKPILYTALVAGVFTACVDDEAYPIPDMTCNEDTQVPTLEVEDIPASATIAQYTQDDIVEAYVTSSDEGGNFFKTISMVSADNSKGFSVPVDVTSTFVNFEPGRKVWIKMKDLYTDVSNGGVRVGAIFLNTSGGAQVGRMPESQYRTALVRSCTVKPESELVQVMTIAEAMNDAHLNKLIELQNVQFSDAAITTTYYTASQDLGGATNHMLEDINGNSIIFRTSSFASFASKPVASGNGRVRGVLTKFGSDYQFMARTERDIMLDNPRTTAFFSENFQAAVDGTNFDFPGWTNVAVQGTRLWKEEAFSGNGYAEFSSFGSGNAVNEAWLITPPINLDAQENEIMTFRTAQHHLDVDDPGNSLTVYISTDFTGDVATATWTPLSVALPTTANAWYEFVSSGPVDLSGFNGTAHIAFKFLGSGTNLNLDGAFQIDDLKIVGN